MVPISETIELSRASTQKPAKASTRASLRPPSACRPLLMVASSAVTDRPPTMPSRVETSTMGQ
ncbi:hypothetical protein D9M68_934120 [compost metagenome]